jgi:hypothetical protein
MSISAGTLYADGVLKSGVIAEHHPSEYIITKVAEEAIPFGRAVVKGTGDNGVKLPSSGTDIMLGVAGFSTEASDFNNGSYAQYDQIAVVDTGVVVVYVEEAVNIGDPVRIRHTASTGKYPGSFAKTADPGKTAVVSNAQWRSRTSSAGYAILYVHGPFTLVADAA